MVCCMVSLAGCIPKTVIKIEYRDVLVPVRCQAEAPLRPTYNPDPVMGVVDILEYCEKLEVLLKTCIGEVKK